MTIALSAGFSRRFLATGFSRWGEAGSALFDPASAGLLDQCGSARVGVDPPFEALFARRSSGAPKDDQVVLETSARGNGSGQVEKPG